MLALSAWLGFNRSGASPSADTMSAYYKLDESSAGTAADSSGDANPGTVIGAASSSDVPATVFGNSHSLAFDGNDYVEIDDAAGLDGPNISISFWVKLNNVSGTQTMVAKWDTNHWQQYVVQQNNGALRFYTGDGTNIASDSIDSSLTLEADNWYHVVASQSGTARSISVKQQGEPAVVDNDTAGQAIGGSAIELTLGSKKLNAGSYTDFLNGKLDDVRVYSRSLESDETTDLQSGNHTSAVWEGNTSSAYDTASNWNIGAVPDPYSYVTIASSSNQPELVTNIEAAGLAINGNARLNLTGHNLALNDGGEFVNDGTLQLKNSETLTGFTNDSDSGTVLLTPDADITGLKTGNSYNNLVINDGTYAHWTFDEGTNPMPDTSGFNRDIMMQGSAVTVTDVPAVSYANDESLSLNGSTAYAAVGGSPSMPDNATWCAWANMTSGSGAIFGNDDQYALAVLGGDQVAVFNNNDNETASWAVSSLYGNWHHICVTQADNMVSYSLELYVDGVKIGSPEVMSSGAGAFDSIGRGNGQYFTGLIDDARVFSRTLTPTEIVRIAGGEQPATFTSTQTLNNDLEIYGNLYLASGRLDVSGSNHAISIGGDLRNDGGIFVAQEGTVELMGMNQLINSSMTFYNLSKSLGINSAATLTFGKDSTTEITNMLTLNGTNGFLLGLRSSTPGDEWFINPVGSETVSYLDIQDSHNIDTEPIDITNDNVTDSGNNTNWTVNVAPGAPTTLGPTQFINGSFGTDSTPTMTFSMADANPVDLLRFQVQIDDNSDFSSPEVDYVSDLAAQGSRSFTPGQNDSDDTYYAGSDSMTMVSGDYYWRVRAIDDYDTPNQSSYTVANSGAIAFKLDITGPTTPGIPSTTTSGSSRKPAWTWTASTDAGTGLANPTYSIQWSTDATFSIGVNASTTNNLTFTHITNLADGQWYFRVRAADTLGNNSAWATSTPHLIDNTGPTTPVAPFTNTPTFDNTPTWSWSAPTDAGSGLAAIPYTLNWSTTSNFSSTVYSATNATNIFDHSAALADGTWYLRVKAVDGLGNESAWSSNGTVLIDGTSPSLPGAPQTITPTNDNTPAWTWDASIDTGSGLAANPYTVQWSAESDFSPLTGSTTTSSNSFTHPTDLADGNWYIRVSSKDALNNQSGWSDVGETTVDTVAPDAPAMPTTPTPTKDDTPAWSWAIPDDNDGGVGLSATPYTFEWSQDADFSSIEDSATAATNSFTHTDVLAEGTWYFRVKATDLANNTSEWSDNGELYIDVTAPTIPGDPSTADPVNDDTPTWIWNVSTDSGIGLNVTPYTVEWSKDNTFASDVSDSTAVTATFTHSSGLSDGTWYFRVKAMDAVGNEADWSNLGSKVVDINPPTTPGTPTTDTPTADNTPAWSWTASTDAGVGLDDAPYLIEWSQDEDFLSGVESDTITPSSFTHPDPLADGTWYFRVRAQDDVGNISPYSPAGSVFVDATDPSAPGTPSTTNPTNDDTPTWNWSPSSDSGIGLATPAYTVEWSIASDFSVNMQSASVTNNTFTHPGSLPDGTWYFRVRATDLVGNVSADSAAGSVEVDDTAPSVPGAPSTITPTADATPSWNWSASTDNGVGLDDPEYELQWSQASDFGSGVLSATSTNNSYAHSSDLADGTWYIRVRAHDTLDNTSGWSGSGTVLIATAGPSLPGTPSTTTPTTDTTPSWTWSASTSPADLADPAYYVEWSQDDDFLLGVDSDNLNDVSFTHTEPLADGVWYFRVRAQDNTGLMSSYSAEGSVRVDTTAPDFATTVSLTSPTADNTPAWSWGDASDSGSGLAASPYAVEWSQTSDFSDGVQAATVATAAHTPSSQLADGTWYIRVRAVDEVGNESDWITTASTVIDATNPSTPDTPSTTTPTADTTPSWNWTASTDGGVGLDNPAYQLQWSQSSSFGSGINSSTTNSTSFTHVSALNDGTWYFRVRSIDDVGNQSAWSANGQVVVDSSVPTTPGTPTTGGAVTNDQTPTWNWTASTDSGVGLGTPGYQVQWSQDNTFLSGVSSDTTSSAAFTHPTDIGAGTWYFRVRAVDVVNNMSGYSGSGTVVIDTDTPSSPGTPSTASPTADTTPTWTWPASSDSGYGFGAQPYELEWSQDNTFGSGVSNATSASTSFTHSTPLTDGTWYFHVRAVDDASNESPYSSSGSVVIDASAPTTPANLGTETPTKDSTPTWEWDASTDSGVGLNDPAYEIEWSNTSGFTSNISSHTTNSPAFTHSTDLDFGMWYFRVRAVDNLNNKTAWVSAEVNIDNVPPVMSSVSAQANSQGATITWSTNEPSSSKVEYGVADQFTETTTESDIDDLVQSHTVSLSGLPSCATFKYRVLSEDEMENTGTSTSGVFTTNGCSGNAAIMGQTTSYISKNSGGSLNLSGGSAALGLSIPSGFADNDADFQAKQLSPAAALGSIGQPPGRYLLGSHVYDLKSFVTPSNRLSSFSSSISVTVSYTTAETAGYTQSSLAIFRHDGSAWQQLSNCSVNTGAKTVTCPTTNFSVFGLFGVRIPAAAPAPAPALPEGDGVVEPDPEPVVTNNDTNKETAGHAESAADKRGIGAAVASVVTAIKKRPVWWLGGVLIFVAISGLIWLKLRSRREEHVPFGIHKDD